MKTLAALIMVHINMIIMKNINYMSMINKSTFNKKNKRGGLSSEVSAYERVVAQIKISARAVVSICEIMFIIKIRET